MRKKKLSVQNNHHSMCRVSTKNPLAHSICRNKGETRHCRTNCLESNTKNNEQWEWRASRADSVIEHWLNIDRKMHGAFFPSLSRLARHCSEVPAKLNKNNRRLIFEIFSIFPTPAVSGYLIGCLVHVRSEFNPSDRASYKTSFFEHVSQYFLSHHRQRYLSQHERTSTAMSPERFKTTPS